ncbi:multidrug resistance-associated protein 5-like [Asterias rubens]|uniref:multidrug resistance-associated protein 5-like n=1 Tax=Asterias rubens TaxID=7604 RepID=UPI0014556946|nr:multidrug resistance-associated protein 5-like [Asterias rubens]
MASNMDDGGPCSTDDVTQQEDPQQRQETRPNQNNEGEETIPAIVIKEPDHKKQGRVKKLFKKTGPKHQRLKVKCPIDEQGILSSIWFAWMTPVFYKAWKGSLKKEDLFSCSPYDSAKVNSERLERLWAGELKQKGTKKASLAMVYFRFLAKRSFISCLVSFIGLLSSFFAAAVFVRLLIEYCQQEEEDLQHGLLLAGGIVLCQILVTATMGVSWYLNIRTGGRVRAATVALIYHKTIRLRSTKGMSIGEIVNLCTNDGQRLFDMLLYLPHALAGPPLALIALIYTIYLIGPAALLGTGVFVFFFPLQALFSKVIAHYRSRSIVVTDHRVRLMSEIISCIKLIKMYAWEDSFASCITGIRNNERSLLRKGGFFQALCQAQTTLIPILSTILTICLHTLLGNNITASQAFSYIAVLNSIRFMIIALPNAMKSLTDCFVAFPRIKSLLLMDEIQEFTKKPTDPDIALSMMNTTFAWDKEESTGTLPAPKADQNAPVGGTQERVEEDRPERDPLMEKDAGFTETLFELNLDVQKGQLLGICGSIGSGKSSLLQAILSRMILVNGDVAIDGSFAYVSQQACIMNMSLRENILLGAEFDKRRYAQAVGVCALQEDFDILADGDQTEIGERGINISGGQKQRVSLARAVYANKDIYLLDDPLSAVDAHVGRHIFSKCVDTALREKTVLFVTHQLQYLKMCDRVILMKDGRVAEDGTHRELMDNGEEYCNLIKTFHSDTSDDSDDVDPQDEVTVKSQDGLGGCDDESESFGESGSDCMPSEKRSTKKEVDKDTLKGQQNNSENLKTSTSDPITPRIIISGPEDSPGQDVFEDNAGGDGKCDDKREQTNTKIIIDEDIDKDVDKIQDAQEIPQVEKTTEVTNDDSYRQSQDSSRPHTQPITFNLQKDTECVEIKKPKDAEITGDSEDEDLLEEDKSGSAPGSPVRKSLPPLRNFMRGISADVAASLACSEESVFYDGKLVEDEETGDRGLSMGTIHEYIQSAGGYIVALVMILFFIFSVGTVVLSNWWLSFWLNAGSGNTTIIVDNEMVTSDSITDNPRLQYYQLVYGSLAITFMAVTIVRCFLYATVTLKASSTLHRKVFHRVVHSPMSFFDVTPLGRILNRFSNDLDELDINLPLKMDNVLNNGILIFFSLLTLALVFPLLLVALLVIFCLYLVLNSFFRQGIRDIKRFENVARSPWFSHIMTTVQSLSTIHAYRKNDEFIERLHHHLDDSTNLLILFYIANRWLAVRFDTITLLLTSATGLFAVLSHGIVPAATIGLAIVYSNQLLGLTQYTVRLAAEVNARFTSVERITYYINELEQEAPQSIKKTKPAQIWPTEGRIVVRNLKMRYRKHLPMVLRGINFDIHPNEKVGIVGRTGSGKSSLGVAMYRLVEKSHGSILIDGVDISQIGLYDLRSKLSIIPQDPVLFIGTIRYNLDPQNKFTDEEIWKALEKTYMKETISNLDQQLQAPVVENGENFSVGERQLLCMARALLRNSKILILDEATAAIDTETDSLIQQTIKQAFTNCTILTIAHRLNTILDSDRIMVLSAGKIVEFDSPSALLGNPCSYFSLMMSTVGDKIIK